MHPREVIDRIKRLNIPHRAKAELILFYSRCRRLVVGILRFIEKHKQFGEAIILGSIVAYLLMHIPWIGGLLALVALVTAASWGLMRQMQEDINQLFALAQ